MSSRRSTLQRKTNPAIMRCMANESRRSQMLRGVLDLCLLAVVVDEPAYGYEMTRRLRDRGLAIVGEGSIYPLLGRLERDGLVETYRAASNGGPPRKYYRPSDAGRLALALGVSEWRAARDAIDAVLAAVRVEVPS
jgi:PadR family transcriptional regulator PadR